MAASTRGSLPPGVYWRRRFAVLTVAQLLALPQHSADPAPQKTSILDDWRAVIGNRSFLLFAAAMIGSYVMSFQVYLALPLQASILTKRYESLLVAAVFVVSGLVAVAGQLRITGWFTARWGRGRSLVIGLAILAASFVPLTLIPDGSRFGDLAAVAALLVSAATLAVGSAAVFPFEMDTVVMLARGRMVATHYGFYNTIVGVGILAGNLATGWLMGAARQLGVDELVWAGLVLVGAVAAWAVHRLDRGHHLETKPTTETQQAQPMRRQALHQEPTRLARSAVHRPIGTSLFKRTPALGYHMRVQGRNCPGRATTTEALCG